jgi:AraC family transcriptional regulator
MLHRLQTQARYARAVREVLEIMRRDPSAPLDLAGMASKVSMSRCHFLRVFEEFTRVTPMRFLAALRIELAKRLLIETSLSITTICFDVGYNSLGTFSRLFIDYVGLSPKSFRGLARKIGALSFNGLVDRYVQHQLPPRTNMTISGSVRVPQDFSGVIFLGLFPTSLPQRRPIDGSLLTGQGRFDLKIGRISHTCYLMAAGFPLNLNMIRFLLPCQQNLLVASTPVIGRTAEEITSKHYDVDLRPLEAFDPPILTALPLLIGS